MPPSTSSRSSPSAAGDSFESELRGLPNVILTPHIGGSTEEAQEAIGQFVATKLRDYLLHGATMLSPNLPPLALDPTSGSHRLTHLHRNTPGVLAGINQVFAEHDVNIEGQLLATRGDLGYVVTDVAAPLGVDVCAALRTMPQTIRLRTLS